MGALRTLDRNALVLPEDLDDDRAEPPLALTLPDGDVELWHADRGELFLFAYTGLAELVESCGPGQPYVPLRPAELAGLQDRLAAPVLVAVDARHPDGARYPERNRRAREPLDYAQRLTPLSEVWIPSLPMAPGDQAARVELYAETAGEPMLLAYPSLDDLYAACGPHQAAVSVRVEVLHQVAEEAGAHGVLFGAELSEELRHQRPVVDWGRGPLCANDIRALPSLVTDGGVIAEKPPSDARSA